MTFTQIRYFLLVAEKKSFSKAAEAAFITQSAMSRQIAILESELGFDLLYRSNRAVALTEAGEVMYRYFSRMQEDLAEAMRNAIQKDQCSFRRLTVAAMSEINLHTRFSGVLEHFSLDHPNIRLVDSYYPLGDLWEKLHSGEANLIVTVRESLYSERGLKIHDLCPLERNLVGRSDYTRGLDTGPFSLILTEEPSLQPYYEKILTDLRKEHIQCQPVYVPNYLTLQKKLRRGEGLVIMDDLGENIPDGEFTRITLHGSRSELCVAYTHETAAVLAFISAITRNNWLSPGTDHG